MLEGTAPRLELYHRTEDTKLTQSKHWLWYYCRTREKNGEWQFSSSVELSVKVIDNESKLRNTLVHELCHVAAWLVDHVNKPPHGKEFQKW